MTPEQFCYWLQGRAELQPDNAPTPEEWKAICEHLATVFHKVTPPIGIDPVKRQPREWGVPGDFNHPPYRVECTTGTPMPRQAIATC
jgi:hypothetical protein